MKRKIIVPILCVVLMMGMLSGCVEEEPTEEQKATLTLAILGLMDLGPEALYEGWILVDGGVSSTGTFSVDDSGILSDTTFEINKGDLTNATAFILTIEPVLDPSADPSDTHILAGDFSDDIATLSIMHTAAIGDDFSTSTGVYKLATPTTENTTDEKSGIWYINETGEKGLDLPTLPTGWIYEGWIVIDGTAISTGRFSDSNMSDDSDIYSGNLTGPEFPGEDLIINGTLEILFPTTLDGNTAVISVEPDPDNDADPFLLKPLIATIPDPAVEHTVYNMTNQAASILPTGTASR
ncbi:MAG: hypothetical protein JSW06_06160 [Thermoplasmatales archaeon]|nr:MAG: hypothetical protein JSW06_06160 [Thermoplasmatales archaeon]